MDANTTSATEPNNHGESARSEPSCGAATFLALFAARVAAVPNKQAVHEVTFNGPDGQATSYTWAELDARARRAAAALAEAGVTSGDRVILCLLDAARFLSFFVGAQALGAIPVPLPSTIDFQARGAFRGRIEAVFVDSEPSAMVFDSKHESDMLDANLAAKTVLVNGSETDESMGRSVAVPSAFRLDRSVDETAFLQYTSGSTGSPKGVVVTHGNLMANLRSMVAAAGLRPTERSFNWLPLYHDMGLIGGLLLALAAGGESYGMPTREFVGRPESWLRAMSQFKATFACAPNFAYAMLARRLPDHGLKGLDLSAWRVAFNGAEPIDRATLEAFIRRFGPVGFPMGTMFPVYGMAECTLAISFPPPGRAPRYDFVNRAVLSREQRAEVVGADASAVCFVSVGRPIPDLRVCVLAPGEAAELPERHIGEIVVAGPSVTPYYFRKDGLYEAARDVLRTGDLGYMADGELYIVDRLKDLIIVAGRNIVPSDVERVIAGVTGTRSGSIVAFALPGAEGTDELYVVVGAEQDAVLDERLRETIRRVVYQHFAVTPKDVVLVTPKAIPKTSSGKVRRSACREQYQRGGFPAPPPADRSPAGDR